MAILPPLVRDGFIDEAAHALHDQMRVAKKLNMRGYTLRSGDMGKGDKNAMMWDDEELAANVKANRENKLQIHCIGAPLNKCLPEGWPNDPGLWAHGKARPTKTKQDMLTKDVPRIIQICEATGCQIVRAFSLFLPPDRPIKEAYKLRRQEIIDWVGEAARLLAANGIAYLLEVEGNQGGHDGETVFDIYQAVQASGNVGIIWDPANVRLQFDTGAETMAQYRIAKLGVRWIHAKFLRNEPRQTNANGFVNEGKGVLAGKFAIIGDDDDSGGRKLLADLREDGTEKARWLERFGFKGGMAWTAEPHLDVPAEFGGFSGEDNFIAAYNAVGAEAEKAGYQVVV